MTSLIRYRAIYERNLTFLKTQATPNGPAHGPSLMNIVMELRKCCNHPFLLRGVRDEVTSSSMAVLAGASSSARARAEADLLVAASGKLVLLDKLLPKLQSEGHRVQYLHVSVFDDFFFST